MCQALLLVGAGPIAVQYSQILTTMGVAHTVVGRGEISVAEFEKQTEVKAIPGGLDQWLNSQPPVPAKAIVAVTENELGKTTLRLLDYGVKSILVEKPGAFTLEEIKTVAKKALEVKADVYIAYNRRFFASTKKAQEIIAEDGGVTSFHFEFTEWGHIIAPLQKAAGVKEQWLLQNSTHVTDLAFYLGGAPEKMSSFVSGRLDWHSAGSIFTGSGRSKNGALFSYHANWEAPGRWAVEILTKKHRLYFKPMEKLQIQKIGSVAVDLIEIDDELDQKFKPGYYCEVQQFLQNNKKRFCMIEEQAGMIDVYYNITHGT